MFVFMICFVFYFFLRFELAKKRRNFLAQHGIVEFGNCSIVVYLNSIVIFFHCRQERSERFLLPVQRRLVTAASLIIQCWPENFKYAAKNEAGFG